MPLLNSLATPYAEALLQVTEARGESQMVSEQCKQLLDCLLYTSPSPRDDT